jgi:hypothetical protein
MPGGLDSRDQSRSRSRSTGLNMTIEIKSRNLDLDRDFLIVETKILKDFERVKIFLTVKTGSLPVSRSRVLIETQSRQIETHRLI